MLKEERRFAKTLTRAVPETASVSFGEGLELRHYLVATKEDIENVTGLRFLQNYFTTSGSLVIKSDGAEKYVLFFPDLYVLHLEDLDGVCWVDIKDTLPRRIQQESHVFWSYNPPYRKYLAYYYVSKKTGCPAFLVFYDRGRRIFSHWSRIDNQPRNTVPLELHCDEGIEGLFSCIQELLQ
jgi:hypothetical protein